jgi:flagellar motility protein MotE (MotC chaperone)
MMEDPITSLIMNGGANAAFAMFLLWQYKDQQKRADDRETKNDVNIKEMRDRYDDVIKGYQAKEEKIRQTLEKDLTDVERRLSLLEQKVDHIVELCAEIKQKFLRVK